VKNEPLYVFMQPETRNSFWTEHIRNGIRDAAKDWQDAVCAANIYEPLPDLNGRYVLLIGNNSSWLESSVTQLMHRGANPVIVNACMLPLRQFRCSGVVFELEEMLDQCMERLQAVGRRRTALLGVSPHTVTDHVKADAFTKAARDMHPGDIVWSPGKLEDCVAGFIRRLDETGYDSVICANDTAAICLIHQLRESGYEIPVRLFVIGMGNSYVGAGLDIRLTSVMFDYHAMGEMAVRLYHNLCQSRTSCHMTVSLPCRLVVRESAPLSERSLNLKAPTVITTPQQSYFDGDEVENIIRVEAMLQAGDAADREILFGIAHGESCDIIAERIFFSGRAVRYRLTNLVKQYGFENRGALEKALRKAISAV